MVQKQISPLRAVFIFGVFTVYFFLLLFTLMPFLKDNFILNPALYWFITGYFLFIPLLVYAIVLAKGEGNKGINQILEALNIRAFSKKDWIYAIVGLLMVFVFTGIIFGISSLLTKYFGIRPLETQPWFMEMKPFEGREKLLLLVWLPMFCLNIAGEEVLWRGYIQTRLKGNSAWMLCSVLWLIFHLTFGFSLMIMLIPVIIILPYAFHKTKNTLVGMFIHGIYNGPLFVAIALGLMK